MPKLSQERLKELLSYDPESGLFYWKVKRSRNSAPGSLAGCIASWGYRHITIDQKIYRGNRLAWLYMTGNWPVGQIDHIDCNRANDAFINLREATQSQNTANGKLRSSNTSGLKGVSWDKEKRKWVAGIKKDYKRIVLGRFDDKHEAHQAYLRAAKRLFGDFARAA